MRLKIKLFIWLLFFPICSNADYRDTLLLKLNEFKTIVQQRSYEKMLLQGYISTDEMMLIIEEPANLHGITNELLEASNELMQELIEKEDFISLWLLSAMTIHLINREHVEILKQLMLSFTLAIALAMKTPAASDQLFQTATHNLKKNMNPEGIQFYLDEIKHFQSTALYVFFPGNLGNLTIPVGAMLMLSLT